MRVFDDPEKQRLADDLQVWWADKAHDEAEKTVDKAIEYGSNSMTDVGHAMARTAGRTITDEEATELGCYFYIVGKLGRWADAVVAGERVSDDTLFDIGVYVRMAQRARSNGGWPGTPIEAEVRSPYRELPIGGTMEVGLTNIPVRVFDNGPVHRMGCILDRGHFGECEIGVMGGDNGDAQLRR